MYLVAEQVIAEELVRTALSRSSWTCLRITKLTGKAAGGRAGESGNEAKRQLQQAVLHIKTKYGKNAISKGMNYEEGATAAQRNRQIGGHKA